jgi:hypothetical protein
MDTDLVADLKLEHVASLVKQLQKDYYIDADAVRDAIRRKSSFNAIHLETMLKIDVFIAKSRLFDQEEMHRASFQPIVEGTRPFYIASPEGTILNKLEWYRPRDAQRDSSKRAVQWILQTERVISLKRDTAPIREGILLRI